MAGFTADLTPKSNAMSLSDMMKIGLYSAEADVLNRQAQVAREKEKELPLIQSVMADPENKLSDGSFDIKKLTQILPAIAPITGPEYATKIVNMTKNHIDTSKALNETSQQERGIIGSVYAAHAAAGTQDPKAVIASLNNLRTENPNLDRLVGLKIQALQQVPGGPEFNKKLFQARNETLTPKEVIDQFSPKAEMANIGGADRVVVRKPSIMGEQPTITPSGFGGQPIGGGATTPTTTSPGTATTSGKMPALINYGSLKYSGEPELMNLNTAQKEAREVGQKMVNDAPYNLQAAKDIQQPIRKVEEFVNSASGSKLYQTLQAGGKYAFGNADLDELVKNISRVQAQNAEVMGLAKTDHMQALNAKLSGSEKIDARALGQIMQQVKADAVAAEKYNTGLIKFVEKHDDVNGQILAKKFQQAWAENYDPRIFQIQNIENSKLPEREQDRRIREIHGSMSKEDFKSLENKAKTLYRLEKGLYQ
jgi:hypothetical protein